MYSTKTTKKTTNTNKFQITQNLLSINRCGSELTCDQLDSYRNTDLLRLNIACVLSNAKHTRNILTNTNSLTGLMTRRYRYSAAL